MITYTVRTDRSETGAATTNDDALAEALATVELPLESWRLLQ